MIRLSRPKQATMISGINITPFTDVCLVLLIIFMVTASALTSERALKMSLPQTSSASPLPESLTVRIDAGQQLYLDDQPVTAAQLESALRTAHESSGVRLLVVKVDEQVPYGIYYQVIDTASRVGIDNIAAAGRNVDGVPTPQP